MALGATTGRLVSMVLRSGALLAVIGCAVGVAASIWLSRLVQGLLFNTAPTDPFVLTSVTAVTLVASIAASLLPARRATKVSPVRSLRGE
jgi:ABC-type antimicrobial peptide transport system permease subunit